MAGRDDEDLTTIAASLANGAARALAGDAGGEEDIQAAISGAESLGMEWLERIGRACLALTGPGA